MQHCGALSCYKMLPYYLALEIIQTSTRDLYYYFFVINN